MSGREVDMEKVIKACENWVNNHKDEDLLMAYSSVVELLALMKEQEADIIAMSRFLESHGWDSDAICRKML